MQDYVPKERYRGHGSLWYSVVGLKSMRFKQLMVSQKAFYLLLISSLCIFTARGSWLSDVTGVNIDLSKAIGGTPQSLNPIGQPSKIVGTPEFPHPVSIPVATSEQRQMLQKKIDSTVDNFKKETDSYQSYAAALVFLTIGIGLAAAVAGFLRKAVFAGVLSLVAVASTGVGKAFPIADRANYYRTLYGQSLTLQVEIALAPTVTVEQYNGYVTRLTTILLFASKLPGVGDAGPVADELIRSVANKQ